MRCTQSGLNFSLYLYTFSGFKRVCTVKDLFQSTLTFGFTFRGHNFSGFQLLKAIRPWCSGIRKSELKSDMWPKIRAPVTGKNTGIGSKNSGFRILESHKDRSYDGIPSLHRSTSRSRSSEFERRTAVRIAFLNEVFHFFSSKTRPCGHPETGKIQFFFGHKVQCCCGKCHRLISSRWQKNSGWLLEAPRNFENGPRNLSNSGGASGILKTIQNCIIL